MNPFLKLAILEAVAKARQLTGAELQKATTTGVTTSTGLGVTIYEQAVRELIAWKPTWFLTRVFRNTLATGTALAWKTLTGLNSTKYLGYVQEGKRGAAQDMTTGSGSAAYTTWGLEDSYTAEGAAQSNLGENPDPVARCIRNLGLSYQQLEERIIFGSNATLALGTPDTPSGTAASGGALTANKYWCKVVALTLDGVHIATPLVLATGLTKTQSVPSPAGETYTNNGGISKASAASSAVDATTNQKITWTTTAIKGAVAYAWYVSTHASADPGDAARYLCGLTYVNSFVETADPDSGSQAISALTVGTDYSTETKAPTGVFYQAMNSSLSYWVSMDNAVLTMTNGRVDQLITMFASMWANEKIGPEFLLMSPNTYTAIEALAFSSSNPRQMFIVDYNQLTQNGIVLGGSIVGVKNPYTQEVVAIVPYDHIPDSLIFAGRLTAPIPGTTSDRTVEIESFGGTVRVDWEPITRSNYHGMYTMGGIKVYAPGYFGAIGNIKLS